MKSFGVIENPVDHTLGRLFPSLRHRHVVPPTGDGRALPSPTPGATPPPAMSVDLAGTRSGRINAIMLTCGHYDGSGRIRLPGRPARQKRRRRRDPRRSPPGKASIAVWSPGSTKQGNSYLGRIALERLSKRLGWSIFARDGGVGEGTPARFSLPSPDESRKGIRGNNCNFEGETCFSHIR